jgi:hypothetical protein
MHAPTYLLLPACCSFQYNLEELGVMSSDMAETLSSKVTHIFLSHVFLPLVDEDGDGMVTTVKLTHLHMRWQALRRMRHLPALQVPEEAKGFLSLMDGVWGMLDPLTLREQLATRASDRTMARELGVDDIIRSFKVSQLLAEYVPGSREWLYNRVTDWLDGRTPLARHTKQVNPDQQQEQHQQQLTTTAPRTRLFLLLAGPGMGKSVFSAVLRNLLMMRSAAGRRLVIAHHFFKAGLDTPWPVLLA